MDQYGSIWINRGLRNKSQLVFAVSSRLYTYPLWLIIMIHSDPLCFDGVRHSGVRCWHPRCFLVISPIHAYTILYTQFPCFLFIQTEFLRTKSDSCCLIVPVGALRIGVAWRVPVDLYLVCDPLFVDRISLLPNGPNHYCKLIPHPCLLIYIPWHSMFL